jgi:ABC-type iron transport system FetAB permease component
VYLTGFALVAAGVSLAANLKLPMTSILLGSSFRVSVLFLEISRMIHSGARTALFETLALGATALTVVRTSPVE